MAEVLYGITDQPLAADQLLDKFGMTYHFGIGFVLGPVRNDFDLFRRFGPRLTSESGLLGSESGFTFETQVLRPVWHRLVPVLASLSYGVVMKSEGLGVKNTIVMFRFGGQVSRNFRFSAFEFTPFLGYQGDLFFNRNKSIASLLSFGLAFQPWFLSRLRLFVEGQANLKDNIHSVILGGEFILLPTIESDSF